MYVGPWICQTYTFMNCQMKFYLLKQVLDVTYDPHNHMFNVTQEAHNFT